MPQGVPTPETVRSEFRAHYLYSGNACGSARAVGLPETTGCQIARELLKDPEFADARRELRDQAKHELLAMRMRVAQVAMERFEADLPVDGFGAPVPTQEKRSEYGKLVLDAEKNAIAAERYMDNAAPAPATVIINVTGPAGTSVERSSD